MKNNDNYPLGSDVCSVLNRLNERISTLFHPIIINGMVCYALPSGSVVHLVYFPGENWRCILAEYAESIDDANKYLFEDGNMLSIDCLSEDEIFDSLIREMLGV